MPVTKTNETMMHGVTPFTTVIERAHAAGVAAVENATIQPMIVASHSNPLDDSSPVEKRYFVPDGVCGFAWVKTAGNEPFGRWAKKNAGFSPAYGGGLQMWVSAYGQSMQKKEAYAQAFARTLVEYGIKASAESRMD